LEDDFARALLGSAEADAPSHSAYVKAAAALGVGVGLGVGASIPAAATVGAAGVASVARWSSWLSGKVLIVGLSAGALVGAGALVLHSSPVAKSITPAGSDSALAANGAGNAHAAAASERGPSVAHTAALSVKPPSVLPDAASAGPKTNAPALLSSAPRHVTAAASARRVVRTAATAAAAPAHVSSNSSLAEQVQSLDRARLALAAHRPSAALSEIARYRAAWPDGFFLTEASVLEVEALAAQGERSRAQSRAADFVAAHPDSPQADRLRALIPTKKP